MIFDLWPRLYSCKSPIFWKILWIHRHKSSPIKQEMGGIYKPSPVMGGFVLVSPAGASPLKTAVFLFFCGRVVQLKKISKHLKMPCSKVWWLNRISHPCILVSPSQTYLVGWHGAYSRRSNWKKKTTLLRSFAMHNRSGLSWIQWKPGVEVDCLKQNW